MSKRFCFGCEAELKVRHKIKFCSNKCQFNFSRVQFIAGWKMGLFDGSVGISTKAVPFHIKRYLHEKSEDKCTLCGWNKIHPITKRVPLEIDHIDGNSDNNSELNLRLICPNCHSLTANFKNLNKGRGRKWRTDKYIKNQF